jgi:hypothetical protein
MLGPQYLGGALADDDAGGHGVAGGHRWQARAIRDPQVADAIDVL